LAERLAGHIRHKLYYEMMYEEAKMERIFFEQQMDKLKRAKNININSQPDATIIIFESYVYWTVHHLYSCVKRKNQLDATYFII